MGIKERKERDREQMRARILETALELFVEQGYESVTLRRIADRIEYSAATIYLYFKDKDDIFLALLRQGFDQLYAQQLAVQDVKEPRERLIAHGRAYIDFAMTRPKLYEIMFVMHSPVKAMAREQDFESAATSYTILRNNVKECIDAGYFEGEDSGVVSFTLWSLVHGVASLATSGRLQMLPEEALRMLVEGAKDFLNRMVAVDLTVKAPSKRTSGSGTNKVRPQTFPTPGK